MGAVQPGTGEGDLLFFPQRELSGTITSARDDFYETVQVNMSTLKEEVDQLRNEVARVVGLLEARHAAGVIEIREVSDQQAKGEVLELFQSSDGPMYFSDIEENIGIDIEQVVRVCRKLMTEGKIKVDDEKG